MKHQYFIKNGFFFSLILLLFSLGCKDVSDKKISNHEEAVIQVENTLAYTSKDSVKAEGLISVATAKMIIETEKNFTLFEVSKKDKYDAGHLPGTVQIWRPDYESKTKYDYGGMCASREEMEVLLSEKGVKSNDLILIYDIKGSCDASRLAFLLKMYGHPKVNIINGGKTAWKAAGFDLTKDIPAPKSKTNFKFSLKKDTSKIATIEDVKAAIDNPEIILLDTREPEEYRGEPYMSKGKLYPFKKGAFAAGCIPSALHLNWSDAVELHDDHRFKCLKDLKYNYKKAGITPDKEIIVYCQSGVRSTHTVYVLTEILGYPNVKNYDGSWIEWTYFYKKDKSVPIQKQTSDAEYQKLYADLKKQLNNLVTTKQ